MQTTLKPSEKDERAYQAVKALHDRARAGLPFDEGLPDYAKTPYIRQLYANWSRGDYSGHWKNV